MSFVVTVDGKVWVDKKGYWPLGSRTDYETFTFLRAHADVIIDGKNTALRFGKQTIETIHQDRFRKLRKRLRKTRDVVYIVMTKHPDESLRSSLNHQYNFQPLFFTKGIKDLVLFLRKKRVRHAFIDGGPTLVASFLRESLLDELFLTITPKIVGNEKDATLTLAEGALFPPNMVKRLKLLSMKKVGDEVFLRYRILRKT